MRWVTPPWQPVAAARVPELLCMEANVLDLNGTEIQWPEKGSRSVWIMLCLCCALLCFALLCFALLRAWTEGYDGVNGSR